MGQYFALGTIVRVVPIDLTDGDFTNENGFFLKSASGAMITYCPMNNLDSEALTKTMNTSEKFEDPELCRKVFAVGSPLPDDLLAGYGV
jgi:hypothetical protein